MAKKIQEEEQSRDNVVDAIKMLAKERGIDEEVLIKAVEEGIVTAFKREFGGSAKKDAEIKEVCAEIDRETGEIFVYKLVTIVDDVLDPNNEISLQDAMAMYDDEELEIGDQIEVGIEVEKLGRLAATAAKNAISQKVKGAESARIMNEFGGKIGEITSGTILRKDARNVYVDIDRAEAVLTRNEQVKGEDYPTNKTMKFLVLSVDEVNNHPTVVLSRTNNNLVKKLFELEVPEIKSGVVQVMAVSREPGQRSKVAVRSRDENIDAKGSCVGPRGQRVQEIMNELGGEKIDIVDWNEDPAFFLSEALQPAKATRVDIEITNKEDGTQDKHAVIVVPDQQFSLAIGRGGQNVKLAARLTGFRIDIKKESDDVSENAQKMIDKFEVVDEEGEN